MSGAGQRDAGVPVLDGQQHVGDGDEAPRQILPQHRAVEEPQRLIGTHRPRGEAAQRPSCHRRDRRRLGPLAADVADDDGPAPIAHGERVVEVPADELCRLGREEADGEVAARDGRQRRRQQALAQHLDGALAAPAGPLAREREAAEEHAEQHRAQREHHQHGDRLDGGVAGLGRGRVLPDALARGHTPLQRGRARAYRVDELLAAQRDGVGPGGGAVVRGHGLDPRHVAGHVRIGGRGQAAGLAGEPAVHARARASCGLGSARTPSGPAGGRQEQRAAGDDVPAQAGLGVDDQPLEVDRRHQIVIGATGRVGGVVQPDGVDEQEGDAEGYQQRPAGHHERDPGGQPQRGPHSANLRTVAVGRRRAPDAS